MLYDMRCPKCYKVLMTDANPPFGITCIHCSNLSHLITGKTVMGEDTTYFISTNNKYPKDLPEQIRRDYEASGPMIIDHKVIGSEVRTMEYILILPEGERNWDLWKQRPGEGDYGWHCVKGVMKRDPATGKRYPRDRVSPKQKP